MVLTTQDLQSDVCLAPLLLESLLVDLWVL